MATPVIYAKSITVGESDINKSFSVFLSEPSATPITVSWQLFSNTATAGTDFLAQSGVLTFNPGITQLTIPFAVVNNSLPEPIENFGLQLFSPSANALIGNNLTFATIIDNDAPTGTPVVSINDFVVDEATREASFFITLNRPSAGVVSMNYATANGSALAGSDYVATSGTLSFAPGEVAKTVKVTLTNDSLPELSEAFNLVLSSLVGATALDAVGTAIIHENDAPQVSNSKVSVDDVVVGESEVYADFRVRLDAPNTGTVTVSYQTFNGTALGNLDVVGQSGFLTFAAGETVKTIRVTLLDNAVAEATENFGLQLFSPSANATLARNIATATIIDNDAATGTPVVSINDFVVDEATREASFFITLNRPSAGVVSMNYATANGSALAGSDYVATSGTLSFAPGEVAKTVKVTLTNDSLPELSEAFNLVLSSLVGATALDAVGTAIIHENDAPQVSNSKVSVDDVVVGESEVYADFRVRLDAPNTGTVTVSYQTFNGTALGNLDVVGQSGFLTFAAGETVKTIRVTLLDGAVAEATENFGLQLFSPSANATLARNIATATIIDNDAATGIPVISITDAVTDENDQITHVTVMLDRPSTTGVTVNYALQGITATAGSDYRDFSTGKVTFAPGETAKTIYVGLLDDNTAESTELFDVVLSGAVGATVGDARAHVVIGRSDVAPVALPTISVANSAALERDGYQDFLVTLSAPSSNTVSVSYQTFNGTAVGNLDVLGQSSSLSFAPGETVKTVRITLIDDVAVEAVESYGLQLFSAFNASIGNALANGTILDNETPLPATLAISGTAGPDILRGTPTADSLVGNAGDDVLIGAAGNDNMAGGLGNDIYLVENLGDVVTEAAGAGTDTVLSEITYVLGANVENLTLIGTAAINGTGNALANVLTGNAGANILNGGIGADSMAGGLGNDTYVVDLAGDAVTEAVGAGTDTVQSGVTYVLGANLENLTLTGTAVINGTGNALANVLTGNSAANILTGGLGNDTYVVGAGDTVTEAAAAGTDTVRSGLTYTLGANLENLTLTGTAAINGTGNALANVITGNSASNTLLGNGGADNLTGGAGNDIFDFNAIGESGIGNGARDLITDFVSGDRIDLTGIDANAVAVGNGAFTFIGTAAFSAAGQLRYGIDSVTGQTVIEGNVNANVATDFQIALVGNHTLVAGDFLL
jgi:hypothetical protein